MSQDQSVAVTPMRRGPVWLEDSVPMRLEPTELADAYDIVVIGAGVVGLSCAAEASRAGLRVAVLERDIVGGGASGRNLGIVNGFAAVEIRRLVERLGDGQAAEVLDWLQACVDVVVERAERDQRLALCRKNKKWVATSSTSKAALVETAELFSSLGVGIEVNEGPAALVAEIGAQVLIDPIGLVRAQADEARAGGAVVSERTRVAALTPGDPSMVTLVDGRVLRARYVVVATNGFLSELVPDATPWPRLAPAVATRPLREEDVDSLPAYLREGHAAMDYGESRYFSRLLADGRLIFGGSRSKEEMRTSAPTAEYGCPPTQVERLYSELGLRFPALSDVGLSTAWAGIVADTPTGLPLVRRCDPTTVAVSACNGGGIALGSSIGRLVIPTLLGRPLAPAFAAFIAA